jgi:hypothetical protein
MTSKQFKIIEKFLLENQDISIEEVYEKFPEDDQEVLKFHWSKIQSDKEEVEKNVTKKTFNTDDFYCYFFANSDASNAELHEQFPTETSTNIRALVFKYRKNIKPILAIIYQNPELDIDELSKLDGVKDSKIGKKYIILAKNFSENIDTNEIIHETDENTPVKIKTDTPTVVEKPNKKKTNTTNTTNIQKNETPETQELFNKIEGLEKTIHKSNKKINDLAATVEELKSMISSISNSSLSVLTKGKSNKKNDLQLQLEIERIKLINKML